MRLLLAAVIVVVACQAPAATPSPSPASVAFWNIDDPLPRGRAGFGVLPPEHQAKRILTIASYELATGLPTAPPTLNVYVAGGYPESDVNRLSIFGEPGWDFVPGLSLLQYVRTDQPLGTVGAITNDADALARAEAVLRPRGLLPADTESTRVAKRTSGWVVNFARRIDGRIDYANNGLSVSLDPNGQVRQILERRRPLLERSSYPTRPAQEAWALARSGRWLTFILEDGASTTPAQLDRFVVRSVDIVYVEGQVSIIDNKPSAHDIIRPVLRLPRRERSDDLRERDRG